MIQKYWIWNVEQQAFRKANGKYTNKIMKDAGQFSFEKALSICREMNKYYVKELMCPTIKDEKD